MEILVNDQPLAFRLEKERTLGDVVRGLEQWLAGSQLVLCEARCGGRDLLEAPPQEWSSVPPAEVGRLELVVRPASELRRENLGTLLEFLRDARAFAARPEAGGAEELLRAYPLVLESLRRHFREAEIAADLQGLAPLQTGSPDSLPTLGVEPRALLDSSAARLEQLIGRRLQGDDPRAALGGLSKELESAAAGISEVSVLLATGRDRQAMEAVVRFSELCQRLLVHLSTREVPAVSGRQPGEFFAELNRALGDLLSAFQAHDTVLIGDLLEYEIAPRLRQLQGVL